MATPKESMMKSQSVFEQWIHPFSIHELKNEYLHQKALYISAKKKKNLLTWEALNHLLDQASIWTKETLTLYHSTQPIPAEEYCRPILNSQGVRELRPHPPLIQKWISRGASLVLNDISTLTPSIRAMTCALQNLFGGRLQANLYASAQGIQAFPSHFDTHDVFVFHTEGEKIWQLYENRADTPINHPRFNCLTSEHHERSKGKVTQELTLKSGDFLYLPRGYYHDALASKGPSLHVTFGITYPIGLDIISLIFEEGINHSFFRQNLIPSLLPQYCQQLGEHIHTLLKDPYFTQKIFTLFKQERVPLPYTFPIIEEPIFFKVPSKNLAVVYHSQQFWLASFTSEAPIPQGKEKLVEWILRQTEFTLEEAILSPVKASTQEWESVIQDLIQMGVIERDS
jgi:ribosomal protein L16 Arg81 hydroxylase